MQFPSLLYLRTDFVHVKFMGILQKFRTVPKFVIANLYMVFHTQFVFVFAFMFMFMPSSNGSLVITIKPKAKIQTSHSHHIVVL
jgi:hypothetical protein